MRGRTRGRLPRQSNTNNVPVYGSGVFSALIRLADRIDDELFENTKAQDAITRWGLIFIGAMLVLITIAQLYDIAHRQ